MLADVDVVIPIDVDAYRGVRGVGGYYGREIYYKLEVFKLRGFERVIYLDCDTIVLGDISALWDMGQYAAKCLYAMRETAERGGHPLAAGKYNTGVMVINRPLLDGDAHRAMVEIARKGGSYDRGDQGVVNRFVAEKGEALVGDLDPEYNVMVPVKKRGDWEKIKGRMRILHFTNHIKPWAVEHSRDWLFDEELKQLWDEAYRPELMQTSSEES